MNLVQLAGVLPRNPEFREWLSASGATFDEPMAAEFIRVVCEIDSRRELASDADAQQRFHDHVRKPFQAWRDQQLERA